MTILMTKLVTFCISGLCAVSGCVTAEILGYFLHRLLHSGFIAFLSRNHMKHHMVLYGPLQDQRSDDYHDATEDSLALGNIGLEWIIPSTLLLSGVVAVLYLLHVRIFYQCLFITAVLGWSFLMFSYMHDVMHVRNHWMEINPLIRRWFIGARRRHDIHHRSLNNNGLMDKNFGIGFFFFDRLFRTVANDEPTFNDEGFQAAQARFKSILRRTSSETSTVN